MGLPRLVGVLLRSRGRKHPILQELLETGAQTSLCRGHGYVFQIYCRALPLRRGECGKEAVTGT